MSPPGADLDRQFALGIAWTGGLRLVTQLVSWCATLVVVRLITPADYGLASMAGVYVTVAAVIADAGLSGAIVASPSLTDDDFARLNSFALILGGAACAASILLAWPVGMFFREPGLPPVMVVMSVILFLNNARAVPRAVMQRKLEYRKTALADAIRSIVQTLCVLAGALAGLGYWALALGALAGSAAATAAVLSLCRPTFLRPSFAMLARPLHYARNIMVGGLAWQTYSISDFIVVGRTQGSGALGLYTLAWNVASVPAEKLTNLLTLSAPAFFASLNSNKAALQRYFLLLTEGIAMLTFPALAGIAFVAADAVTVLWGEKWLAAIVPLRVLAVYAMLNSLATPFSQVLAATGQVVAVRRNAMFALAVLVPAFYVASTTWGISAVALSWLLLYPIVNARPFSLVLNTLSVRWADYVGAIRPAVLTAGAIVLALTALRAGLTRTIDPLPRLIVEVTIGLTIGLALARLTYWHRLRTAWHVVRAEPLGAYATPSESDRIGVAQNA